jgi:hypothetical protein
VLTRKTDSNWSSGYSGQSRHGSRPEGAGVVDQEVEPPRAHRGRKLGSVAGIGDVPWDDGRSPSSLEGSCGAFEGGTVPRVEDQVPAPCGELAGELEAQSLGRSCDDCCWHLVLHVVSC